MSRSGSVWNGNVLRPQVHCMLFYCPWSKYKHFQRIQVSPRDTIPVDLWLNYVKWVKDRPCSHTTYSYKLWSDVDLGGGEVMSDVSCNIAFDSSVANCTEHTWWDMEVYHFDSVSCISISWRPCRWRYLDPWHLY